LQGRQNIRVKSRCLRRKRGKRRKTEQEKYGVHVEEGSRSDRRPFPKKRGNHPPKKRRVLGLFGNSRGRTNELQTRKKEVARNGFRTEKGG